MSQISAGADPQVAKTIFLAEIDAALNFSMVEYADGRLDILRNGSAISPSPWPPAELPACVATFQKIARLAAAAAAAQEGLRPEQPESFRDSLHDSDS